MKILNFSIIALSLTSIFFLGSCDKDDEDDMGNTPMQTKVIDYEFNNGQVVPTAPYEGEHGDDLTAQMKLTAMEGGQTKIEIMLTNTVNGAVYNVHAHDMKDPATTPNGTPYDESPNADVLVQQVTGNGDMVTVSQVADLSFDELTTNYEGFFVIHDPLQPMSTVDISTYLVVSTFARDQNPSGLAVQQYSYDFNTGQIDSSFSYGGTHPANLNASLRIQELADGRSRVSVILSNTLNGETYMVHAHDKMDPANTPNGTPYDEAPNADVLVQSITGNGGEAMASQLSTMSISALTGSYEAFFVVHDPLQPLSTVDPTTYLILGNFAR